MDAASSSYRPPMDHAANPRARALARQVNVPNLVVYLNKCDLVDDVEP